MLGTSERDIVNEKIYILLPVHNRRETTSRFICSLNAQSYRNFHLVLIDDGSTDGTADLVGEAVPSVVVLRGTGGWWWAGALQRGYDWLNDHQADAADFVLMINDDTEFAPDFLERALSLLRGRERSMLQAWCYCRASGDLIDSGGRMDWRKFRFSQAESVEAINCLSTNGLLMRIGDFRATGGFYPKLLPHYLSDYEFSMRACRLGIKPVTDPSFALWLDQTTSGYHDLYVRSIAHSLRRIFSKKSSRNPFIFTAFVYLASPSRYKFINLLRVWRNFLFDCYLLIKAAREAEPK